METLKQNNINNLKLLDGKNTINSKYNFRYFNQSNFRKFLKYH